MPAVKRSSKVVAAATLMALVALTPGSAYAGGRGGDGNVGQTNTHGDADGDGNLSATAGVVVFDRSKNGSGGSAGPVTSASGTWTPP
ncbi:hypothetical protein ABT062_29900, partial [Streptomyces sp. NPDC002685]